MKDDNIYIGHMLDTAQKALSKVENKTKDDFDADENLRLALAHLVQIIGEAARRVSQETQDSYADIPWKAIMGMRHKIVHDYLNVDTDILWETVTTKLAPLVADLEKIVPLDEN